MQLFVVICAAAGVPLRMWHITDVHVDPYYIEGSDATSCYCETGASCPRMGNKCELQSNKSLSAGHFGNSEGDCATPLSLYESTVQFMAQKAADAPVVFFTGDFSEAGASYPCSTSSSAQSQITSIIGYDFETLKSQLPKSRIFGCLGNHDSAPGDVFGTTSEMAWLYESLAIQVSGKCGLARLDHPKM